MYISMPLFLMAREISPNLGSMAKNNLKFWWGVMLGMEPSIDPRSLTHRTPPGSSKALRRSKTEALAERMITEIDIYYVDYTFHNDIFCVVNNFWNMKMQAGKLAHRQAAAQASRQRQIGNLQKLTLSTNSQWPSLTALTKTLSTHSNTPLEPGVRRDMLHFSWDKHLEISFSSSALKTQM